MIYKYYRSDSLHAICNFCKDQLFFNNIYEYEDKKEFEIVSDDEVIRKTGLDLAPHLKEKRAFIIRVCSLCKKSDSDYMWKKYASNEEGFCLGYEMQDIMKAEKNLICGDISYDDLVPELSDSVSPIDIFKNQIFHKLKKWENEDELRICYFFTDELIQTVDFNAVVNDNINLSYIPVSGNHERNLPQIRQVLPKIKTITVVPKEIIIGRLCNDGLRKRLKEIAEEKNITVFER